DFRRHIAEDAAYDGEPADLKDIGRGNPAHDFAGGAGKAFVDGVIHAVVRLTDPAGQMGFIFANDVNSAVGGAAVDNEVFEIRVVLCKDGEKRLLDVLGRVEGGGDERDAGQGHGRDAGTPR